ncbi:MAG: nucleoside triphosphate pyrophosphatase [Parvularcula sp.]|nr:nucleoside triphosphate pyrophosphatase [Parvularcula sp.]
MTPIVLASGSASRRKILDGAGVRFTVARPTVDEDILKRSMTGLSPADVALALAKAKGGSVEAPGALVIAADQVMEFEGRAYDKPKSMDELRTRLLAMAGQTHFLRGGVAMFKDGEVIAELTESSALTLREMAPREVDLYIETIGEELLSTVGGYALEGVGARLFERIEGDFFSILGLPLLPVLNVLRREGGIAF